MLSFEQSDGNVIIRRDSGLYIETEADFALDFGSAAPAIPDGYIGRVYRPGERHHLTTGDRNDPQTRLWAEGDAILAAADSIETARDLRKNPPVSVADHKKTRISETNSAAKFVIEGRYDAAETFYLLLADPSNPDRIAYASFITTVRTEKERVLTLIRSKSSKTTIDTAFKSLSLPA